MGDARSDRVVTIHVDETAFIATIRRSDGTPWPERGMVPHNVVQRACLLVDSSGLVDDLARWRTEDQDGKGTGRGGRPATVGDHSLLALLIVLTIENAPPLLTRMAEIVTNRLEPASRDWWAIGFPDRVGCNPLRSQALSPIAGVDFEWGSVADPRM